MDSSLANPVSTVILASSSPTRLLLLENAGVRVKIAPARIDEATLKASMLVEGAPARDIADTLASLKAQRISRRYPEALVLGCDQVLVLDGKIFDKPQDRSTARSQMQVLRGRTHELLSAAVIFEGGAPVWRHIGRAQLTMRDFTDDFLDSYLSRCSKSALSSVGCYRLEGRGAQLFSRVQGDYFSVLGLPLLEVLGYLRTRGVCPE